MLAQRRRRWPSITSALGQCILLFGKCFRRRDGKRHPHNNSAFSKHGTITQCSFNVGPGHWCEADPTLNRNLVGRPTSSVRARIHWYEVSAVWKKQKMFLTHPRVKVSIVGSLRDREVACSASDRQGSNFESCVWRTVSSQSSHHPQEVLLAQFSLYVHKGGLKPDSFHFIGTRYIVETRGKYSMNVGQHRR